MLFTEDTANRLRDIGWALRRLWDAERALKADSPAGNDLAIKHIDQVISRLQEMRSAMKPEKTGSE